MYEIFLHPKYEVKYKIVSQRLLTVGIESGSHCSLFWPRSARLDRNRP